MPAIRFQDSCCSIGELGLKAEVAAQFNLFGRSRTQNRGHCTLERDRHGFCGVRSRGHRPGMPDRARKTLDTRQTGVHIAVGRKPRNPSSQGTHRRTGFTGNAAAMECTDSIGVSGSGQVFACTSRRLTVFLGRVIPSAPCAVIAFPEPHPNRSQRITMLQNVRRGGDKHVAEPPPLPVSD